MRRCGLAVAFLTACLALADCIPSEPERDVPAPQNPKDSYQDSVVIPPATAGRGERDAVPTPLDPLAQQTLPRAFDLGTVEPKRHVAYEVIDLGPSMEPRDINRNGVVVAGYYPEGEWGPRGVVMIAHDLPRTLIFLQQLPSPGGVLPQVGEGVSIASDNAVVGTSSFGRFGHPTAAYWSRPFGDIRPTPISPNIEGMDTNIQEANGINDLHMIVGARYNHAWLRYGPTGGSDIDLHRRSILPPAASTDEDAWSVAKAINNHGVVVGAFESTDGGSRSFLLDVFAGTPMVDLGTLGGPLTHALSINDDGAVVGLSDSPGALGEHAFLFTRAEGMIDLGTLMGPRGTSRALDINAYGVVVGQSMVRGPDVLHAFAYTRAGSPQTAAPGMVDLNYRIREGTDWVLLCATAINDAGQIVGIGKRGPVRHAFLLDPIPG